MESEKVKEIKEKLKERYYYLDKAYLDHLAYGGKADEQQEEEIYFLGDIRTLINELESENERLSNEKEDLRLFDIALGNGKVDMTLGGNTAKSFINAIVQIFEQNNATNFLATTIETVSSGNKYSLVIQKENGQTPSEKLTELKDRIFELENQMCRNEDLHKATENLNDIIILKQFAERLKEKAVKLCGEGLGVYDIDETLKEFWIIRSK